MSHIMIVQTDPLWATGKRQFRHGGTLCLLSIDLSSVKEGCATSTVCIDYLMTDTSL